MDTIRAFIAIELPAKVKAELSRIQSSLKQSAACPAKWVAPESIHLTLCFLGEISSDQVEAVKSVMAQTSQEFRGFKLELAQPGVFPNPGQTQTAWVGLQGQLDILSALHNRLEDKLRTTGYKPESRPFKPHLTIARVRDEAAPAARCDLADAVGRLELAGHLAVDVSEMSLMKSQLSRSGAIYTCLYSAKLA